jgi:hypothetical protein
MSSKRFGNLKSVTMAEVAPPVPMSSALVAHSSMETPPSRVGRKQISGFFTPEMSFAMNVCARRHALSLQQLMAEAFNDVLRKYGESPIGE